MVDRSPGRWPASWPISPPSARTVMVVAIALAVLALAALGGWTWYGAQQRRVLADHGEVMASVQPALGPEASADVKKAAIHALEQLLERHPSARTVPEAAYELGNIRFAAGQPAAARAAYELAAQRANSALIRALARMGIARTWEAERDFARAAEAYGGLVKDLDSRSFLYEDALLDHARMLELAGKKDEAIATYQRMLKEIPMARRADDVRSRLASLGTTAR